MMHYCKLTNINHNHISLEERESRTLPIHVNTFLHFEKSHQRIEALANSLSYIFFYFLNVCKNKFSRNTSNKNVDSPSN